MEEGITIFADLWELLNQDVALIGQLNSPLLSWLGVLGMILFFLWQSRKLKNEAAAIQQAFQRIHPMLATLVEERRNLIWPSMAPSSQHRSASRDGNPNTMPVRIDRDDLQTLDAGMKQEPLFRDLWEQYRKTLLIEQVPWFMEPRVFATRPAAAVFSQEAVLMNQMNMAFFRQIPSLITGFGLLLTFLALLIGLGKLHAEGGEIMGIQGLINGLAGKFLTSIVGLGLAHVFLFLEKPLLSRLMVAHRTFLSHIDRLFPQKTLEQMLDQWLSQQDAPQNQRAMGREIHHDPLADWVPSALAETTTALNQAVQSLTARQEEEQAQLRQTVQDVPSRIREELQIPLRQLTETVQELTQFLKERRQAETQEKTFEDRPFLWKAPAYPRDSSGPNLLARITAWPKRAHTPLKRRTG